MSSKNYEMATYMLFECCCFEADPNRRMNKFFSENYQYKLSCFVYNIISLRNIYLRFGIPNEVVVYMFDSTDSEELVSAKPMGQ